MIKNLNDNKTYAKSMTKLNKLCDKKTFNFTFEGVYSSNIFKNTVETGIEIIDYKL